MKTRAFLAGQAATLKQQMSGSSKNGEITSALAGQNSNSDSVKAAVAKAQSAAAKAANAQLSQRNSQINALAAQLQAAGIVPANSASGDATPNGMIAKGGGRGKGSREKKNTGPQVCFNFLDGKCARDDCKFTHDKALQDPRKQPGWKSGSSAGKTPPGSPGGSSNSSNKSGASGDKVCHFHQPWAGKTCRSGDAVPTSTVTPRVESPGHLLA